MLDFLVSLGAWNWWILGIALMLLELAAPGVFMLWFGVAAIAVGLLSLAVDWGWQAQVVTFAVIAMASVGVARYLQRRSPGQGEAPFLNTRADALVGRRLRLEEPIVSGAGRVSVDDTVWRVRGPDLPAGAHVVVTGAEGSRLVVAADAPPTGGGRAESAGPPTA